MTEAKTPLRALVTGASGYVGGQLVPRLLEDDIAVRVLTRSADSIKDEPWADDVEVSEGDATQSEDLLRALEGADVAYYLLHSMDGGGNFHEREVEMAATFGEAAEAAKVKRIVYLGGIHPTNEDLSEHMESRKDVGEIFLASGVPTAALQAAVVLGGGSVSFQMLHHLTRRLPIMISPKWLRHNVQPIAARDAMHYLVGAARLPANVNRVFDIAGPEVMTYEEMMQRYAKTQGWLPRLIIPVPLLTTGLASHWIGLVTPIDAGVARPLVGSLVHDVVAKNRDVDDAIGLPPGGLTTYDEAVEIASGEYAKIRGREADKNPADVAGIGALVGTAAAAGLAVVMGIRKRLR